MFGGNPFVAFLHRLVEQDAGIHDKGSRQMIIAVLTAALLMDALFVIFRINPEVMFIYGLVLGVTLILALRGNLVPARLVIPFGGLVLFAYLMFINRGIRDMALLGLPLVIIAAGLLFGKIGTLLYGSLALVTILAISRAEWLGSLPVTRVITNTWSDYLAASIAVVLVAILQWLVIDRLNENIKKAQRNDEAQRLANAALRLSEARFRSLIEESPQGIVIADDDGLILLVNPFACQLLGYEETELIGSSALELIDPEFLSTQPVPEAELRAGKILQWDNVLVCKSGERVPVLGSYRYIPDGRFQFIFQDVRKQKQAEAEREALIRELESKNVELERFTYTVSHDLKSPLVTIRGFLGYLEQDVRNGNVAKMQDDMQRIEGATDRMNRLLMDLLELSRIGRLMNSPERVPLGKIVAEAVELTQGRLRAGQVNVAVQPDLPVVFVDRVRLVEVLQNLIDNAVKFMGRQPEPRVEIGARTQAGQTVFFIRDNGIGIAPEFHDRVFGLFNRLDQAVDGTGIGLTLVKRIIEVHGGTIWIESQGNGAGSTFCFTLAEK